MRRPGRSAPASRPDTILFADTFTNYYSPQIGLAAVDLLEAAGLTIGIAPSGNINAGDLRAASRAAG